MSAFLSLVGGLAQGAGDTYGDIAKQKRQTKIDQDKLVSDAILKEVQTNPNLDANAHAGLLTEYYKRMGVPTKDANDLIQHHLSMFQSHEAEGAPLGPQPTQSAQSGGAPPSLPAIPGEPAATSNQAAGGQVAGPVPTMGQFTAPYPNAKTVGEINANRVAQEDFAKQSTESSRQIAVEGAKQDAELKRQSALADAQYDKYQKAIAAGKDSGAHMKQEFINGQLRAVPDTGVFEGNVYGGEVQDQDLAENLKDKILRRRRYADGSVAYEPVTTAKVTVVNDPSSPLGAFRVVQDAAGNFISKTPIQPSAAYLPSQSQNFRTVQNKDGSTSMVPVTTSTQKVAPSAATTPQNGQVAPPVPEQPGQVPAAAPGRPVPGQPVPRSATPSSPLPSRGIGAPVVIPGAGKAFSPEQEQANRGLYSAVGTTANRLQQIVNNADLLENPTSAARIKLATSSDMSAQALSRIDGLTPREAKVAALFVSGKEDINTIRKQYNATAFKGPQALDAMQNLFGNPLSNPKVTLNVMRQTLESLNAQKKNIIDAFKEHGLPEPSYVRPSDSYKVYRKNPQTGHVIGSDDGQNWFDVQTEAPVK